MAVTLAGCETPTATDQGPLDYVKAGTSTTYLSNRDCGYSTKVEGNSVIRYFWVFCDSAVWDSGGTPLSQPFGFATNSAGLTSSTDPDPLPMFLSGSPTPVAITRLITPPGSNKPDTCTGGYKADWPTGIVTLLDNESTTETVLIFYQNFCVHWNGTYDYAAAGVAKYVWDSASPDTSPTASVLTEELFPVATTYDKYLSASANKFTYGQGAVAWDGYVYTWLCGPNDDCSVARTAVSASSSGATNASNASSLSNWMYQNTSDGWTSFPTSPACSPSTYSNCGGSNVKVVAAATSGQYITMPRAGVNVVALDGSGDYFAMSYSPNDGNNYGISDHAAIRMATSPAGVFDSPGTLYYPDGACPNLCRTPIIHPETISGTGFGFTFYAEADMTVYNSASPPTQIEVGRLRRGTSCAEAFLYEDQPC